jgi:DnaJ domain
VAKDDFYARLGVSREATPEQVKRAYRRAAKHAHPDAEGGSAERWAALAEAYDILSDPRRRRIYDETGSAEAREPDNHAAAIMMRIAVCLDQIAAQASGRPWTAIDWVGSLRNTLNAEISQIRQGIPQMHDLARKWESVAQRCRAAADKPNVVAAIAAGKARECGLRIEQAKGDIEQRQAALKLIEGARFMEDTMPQAMAAMGGNLGSWTAPGFELPKGTWGGEKMW